MQEAPHTCHPERSEFIRECERTRAVEGSLHCLSQQRRFREFSPAHLSRRRRQSVERLEAVVVAHANVGVLRLRSHFASRSGCSAQDDKILGGLLLNRFSPRLYLPQNLPQHPKP